MGGSNWCHLFSFAIVNGVLLSFYGYSRNNNEHLIKESSSYSSNYSFSGNQLNIAPEVFIYIYI